MFSLISRITADLCERQKRCVYKLIIKSSVCVESDPADPNTFKLSALTPGLLLDEHARANSRTVRRTDACQRQLFRPHQTCKPDDGAPRVWRKRFEMQLKHQFCPAGVAVRLRLGGFGRRRFVLAAPSSRSVLDLSQICPRSVLRLRAPLTFLRGR